MSYIASYRHAMSVVDDALVERRFADVSRIRREFNPFTALDEARRLDIAGEHELALELRQWLRTDPAVMSNGGDRHKLGHAVADGVLRFLSVSAITLGDARSDGCPRKWWYRYVGGKREAQTAAQTMGVEMHADIAKYLNTGDRSFGQLAMTGLPIIPDPGDDLLIEHPITPLRADVEASLRSAVLTAGGIPLIGDIDLAHRRGTNKGAENIEDAHDPPGTAEVLDWKSTGDGKYAKTAHDLPRTVQMSGYAEYVYRVLGDDDIRVRLSHGYFFTRKRLPARKVSILVDRETISRSWGHAEGVARSLSHIARETDPDKVPANLAACRSFGGCPHRNYCKAGQTSSLDMFLGRTGAEAILNPDKGPPLVSIMDLIKKDAAPAPLVTPPPTPATDARAAAIAALPAGIEDALAAIRTDSLGRPQMRGAATDALRVVLNVPATPGAPLAGAGALASMMFDTPEQIVELGQILRDPARRAELVAALAPAPLPEPVVPRVSVGVIAPIPVAQIRIAPPDAAESHPALAQTQAAPEAPIVPPGSIAQVTEERPKARTRTKRVDPAGTAGDPAPTPAPAAGDPPAQTETPALETAPAKRDGLDVGGLMIFVDCIPHGIAFTDLAAAVDKWCDLLAGRCPNPDGTPLLDVRFAGDTNQLGFGKWKGALSALVRESAPKMQSGAYYLDTRGDERAQLVAAALRSSAHLYVRGAL